jgi:hypothetical protein
MGKVGSTSIYFSLKNKLPAADIFHVHFLSDYWLKEKLPKTNTYFHGNINYGKKILYHIQKNPKKRIKIITLIREPIIRDISDFFQNWGSEYNNIDDIGIEKVSQIIEENTHEYTLNWFDSEFKNYLGFNIYDIPFNKEDGYSIYNLKNADILCLKLESLNKAGEKSLKEFLGIRINFFNKNTSLDKVGKNLYLEVKEKYKASKNKLSVVYNSKFVKHFYTAKEIEVFEGRWGKPPG